MSTYIFTFVILHYNEKDVTIECIDTIKKKTKGENVKIVIVDNNSPDGSGVVLYNKYIKEDFIKVILLEDNLGFAKGNNIGYQYAKKQLQSDFICIMNNDVLLQSENFVKQAVLEYEKYNYGVIGPHITLLNGKTNYMYLELMKKEEYEKEWQKAKKMYKYYTSKLFYVRNFINQKIDQVLKKYNKINDVDNEAVKQQSTLRHENIVLHGCCLIFTPYYLEKFEDAFNPRTFMFREEELLYIRCRKEKVNTIYTPQIDVLHLEDVSTNSFYKKDKEREAFKWKCQVDSLQILLEEL